MLALAGYTVGETNGKFGKATRAAIKAWQIANGEKPTGYLDPTQISLIVYLPADQLKAAQVAGRLDGFRLHTRGPHAVAAPL